MEEQLKKLQICVYIIIALLLINTIALFASLKDPSEKEVTNTGNNESYSYDVSMFTEIDADGYMDALNGEELQVVYLGRPTCGYCIQFLPYLKQAQAEYGYTTLYIDTDEISNDDLTRVLETMGLELSTFGTPTIALVHNGEVVDMQIGYTEYSSFASLLENNGFTK